MSSEKILDPQRVWIEIERKTRKLGKEENTWTVFKTN